MMIKSHSWTFSNLFTRQIKLKFRLIQVMYCKLRKRLEVMSNISMVKLLSNMTVTSYLLNDFAILEICKSVTKLTESKRKKFYGLYTKKGNRILISEKTQNFSTKSQTPILHLWPTLIFKTQRTHLQRTKNQSGQKRIFSKAWFIGNANNN